MSETLYKTTIVRDTSDAKASQDGENEPWTELVCFDWYMLPIESHTARICRIYRVKDYPKMVSRAKLSHHADTMSAITRTAIKSFISSLKTKVTS